MNAIEKIDAKIAAYKARIVLNPIPKTRNEDENDFRIAHCLDIAATLPKKWREVLIGTLVQHQGKQ